MMINQINKSFKTRLLITLFIIGVLYPAASYSIQDEEVIKIQKWWNTAETFKESYPDSVVFFYKMALSESKKIDRVDWEAFLSIRLAEHYYKYSEKDSALYFNEIAKNSYGQLKDTLKIAACYAREGVVRKRAGELEPAIEALFISLRLLENQEDSTRLLGLTLNNIASVFNAMNDFEKAEKYAGRSLKIHENIADSLGIASCFHSLGNIKLNQAEYEQAVVYMQKALKIYEKSGKKRKVAAIYNNLGNAALERQQYEQAMTYFKRAIERHKELKSYYSLAILNTNISDLLQNKGQFKEALHYGLEAKSQAEAIGAKNLQVNALSNLIKIYRKTGELRKEYEEYVARDSINSVISQTEVEKTIAELELKYNKEKVESELFKTQTEHKEKTQQRNWLLISSIMLFGLFVSLTWAYWQKRQGMILLNRQKQVIEQSNHDKGVLMQELHHRVKNNLQLVSSLLSLQSHQMKDDLAADLVKESQRRVEAMTMIHQALYRGEQNTHIDMKDFLLRLTENLRYAYSFESEKLSLKADLQTVSIIADQAIPLGLILNELLSNVFKHAYKGIQQPELSLTMEQNNAEIYIEVRDNGLGLKDELSDKSDSFGRNLIQSLIRQLKGSIRTYNEQGCVTEIIVPLEQIVYKKAVKTKTPWQKYEYS